MVKGLGAVATNAASLANEVRKEAIQAAVYWIPLPLLAARDTLRTPDGRSKVTPPLPSQHFVKISLPVFFLPYNVGTLLQEG